MRLIVSSATYRQDSRDTEAASARDPGNALLSRQNRLRLPAELIRDSALAASGLLSPVVGGKSVFPPQPGGVSDLSYSKKDWDEDTGPDRYRRGLYVFLRRTSPYPMLVNFDAPDTLTSVSRRERSNTPLQALNLLNDPVFGEAADALAYRVAAGWAVQLRGPAWALDAMVSEPRAVTGGIRTGPAVSLGTARAFRSPGRRRRAGGLA